MNNQEIFDKVAEHLLRQKAQSSRKTTANHPSACAYRGDNGLKCAVGVLIDDEDYTPYFEGQGVRGLLGIVAHTTVLWSLDGGVVDAHTLRHRAINRPLYREKLARIKDKLLTPADTDPRRIDLLHDLQLCHDTYEPELWYEQLRSIAEAWNLDASVVDRVNAEVSA